MKKGRLKAQSSDVVIATREHQVVQTHEELRIGCSQERPDCFTLSVWREGFHGELVCYSDYFTVDRATLVKIRDGIDTVLTAQ